MGHQTKPTQQLSHSLVTDDVSMCSQIMNLQFALYYWSKDITYGGPVSQKIVLFSIQLYSIQRFYTDSYDRTWTVVLSIKCWNISHRSRILEEKNFAPPLSKFEQSVSNNEICDSSCATQWTPGHRHEKEESVDLKF